MQKSSRVDRIKDKTERVKGLFTLRGKDEDGSASFSVSPQTQEPRNSHGSSALLPSISHTAPLSDDGELRNTPIGELWNLAYKKLQQEESALVEEYETRLRGNVTAALGTALAADENKGRWMGTMLRCKMEEVQKNIWKISFRSTEIQPAEVVQSILGVVKLTNDFVASALASNPYASLAWAGVGALLSLFLNPMDQAASLAKGLNYISSLIVQGRMREDLYHRCYELRHNNIQSSSVSHVLYKSTLEKLYRQILKFQATCYCYYAHNGAARLGRDLTGHDHWAGLLERIQQQEAQMTAISQVWSDKQYDDECAAAEVRHKETMHNLTTVGADISGLREAIEEANKKEDHQDFYQWLSGFDPSNLYNAARKRHEAGTSEWFIESKTFITWMNSPRSFLWLNGKAGSGKSVLSSSVIKFLQKSHNDDATVAIAYYYFTFSDLKNQDRDGMLSSLIKQICCCRPNMPESVARLGEYKIKGMRPPTEELEEKLIATVPGFSKVYIIIDGLDECPELGGRREELMKSLRYILTVAPDNLHIFCASRKESDIHAELQTHFSEPTRVEFDISSFTHQEAIKHDIGRYIDSTFADANYGSWPETTKSGVKKALIERSDGMFQYVRCQFEVLRKLTSPSEIQHALDDLPEGLDQTYERMLSRIDPKYQKHVLGSLKWLAFSLEGLTVPALEEIFTMRPEDDTIISDITRRLFKADNVLKYFSGLVIVTYGKVRLAHFSVKEYLTSSRIRHGDALVFGFSETDAHLWIAYSCLAYHVFLNMPGSEIDQRRCVLKTYAACNWPIHLEMVPQESWTAKIVEKMALGLAMRSPSFLRTLIASQQSHRIKRRLGFSDMAEISLRPYCYTAWRGCTLVTGHVLSQGFGINRYLMQEDLDMALYYAVCGSNQGTVRLLLDKGANPNSSMATGDNESENAKAGDALQEAAYQGNLAIVNLLLDKGADVNAQRGGWGSPLQAAAKGQHLHIVKCLVEHGADINGPSNEEGCVLSSAIGNVDCLRFLLDSGADVNICGTGNMERTALCQAAKGRCWSEFDLLLDHGAKPNLGGKGGYPLHELVINYKFNVDKLVLSRLKRLLELGADPNAQDAKHETALHKACEHNLSCSSNCSQVMQLLIDHGADVNIAGDKHGTMLQRGAYKGCLQIVKLLLEKGVEVNIQGGEHGNALQAARRSHTIIETKREMIQLLIEHGADINANNSLYGTALQVACYTTIQGRGAVPLLLKLGADVNAEGGKYGNALQAACRVGNVDMIVLLLDSGADINAVAGEGYGTALQAACASAGRKGSEEVVRLLLERGADVNAGGGKLGTALQTACITERFDGQLEILRMLLDHGADVNAVTDDQYGTVLQAACAAASWDGSEEIVRLLIERGADVNAEGGEFGTALIAACAAAGNHRSQVEKISMLLEHGARVTTVHGADCASAIQIAASVHTSSGDTNAPMKLLLDHGADINGHGSGELGSALHCVLSQEVPRYKLKIGEDLTPSAVLQTVRSRIRFLLDRGADVNLEGGKYGFPLQAACSVTYDNYLHPHTGYYLRVSDSPDIRIQFLNIAADAAKMLIDECPHIDVNATGGIFGTALQAAAYSGQTRTIRLLLDRGAEATLNKLCGKYRTALNAAVIQGHWDIVDILLQAGAKPDCYLAPSPDPDWLAQVRRDNGQTAVKRYEKFWEVEKSLHEQTLLKRGRHVAYYHFMTLWLVGQFRLLIAFFTETFKYFIRKQ
ncbi:ankyrin repeat-containing domain protein [Trichoderma chlorosporum]